MEEKYFPEEIEQRQQKRWAQDKVYEVEADSTRKKFYVLEMLPYPSGRIHMGHVRNYSIGDALACYKRMTGHNVIHPMGWDAFGMPAENAAIKHNTRPDTWTFENINTMRNQLKRMGFNYDWRREIASCTPEYYKWNQWFLIRMWEKGLLYRKNAIVNWCVKCNTSLANEQAEGGFCWRHEDTPVKLRELEQWFIRVTNYADHLLDDLDSLEDGWPDRVLSQQRNWIGRSRGAEVDWKSEDGDIIRTFTTRIDTIYGANAIIVAPEHPYIDKLISSGKAPDQLKSFIDKIKSISREDRIAEGTDKEGVNTATFVINPFNHEKVPVWTANFVVTGYGTGALGCVPAHDERDFEFSQKYNLPMRRVIKDTNANVSDDAPISEPFTIKDETGILINSDKFNGLTVPTAITAMTEFAEKNGFGNAQTNFRIRDWGISRQRAWGTPIPFIHCPKDGIVAVPNNQLPVELPADLNFNSQGSPLAEHATFVNVTCPKCGGAAKRDTDTCDTFIDSSWYYFRYCDPNNDKAPFDPAIVDYWMPVDLYIGGIEHAVLHLIYTRLWTKIMRDLGLIKFDEPVKNLLTQGMVCLQTTRCPEHDWLQPDEVIDGKCKFCSKPVIIGRTEKMSKSKKNTVDPDEMIKIYGADTVRLFMLFAAPPEKDLEWSEAGAEGAFRFLNRVWRIVYKHHKTISQNVTAPQEFSAASRALRRKTHHTIDRISKDISQRLNFNTSVAALMELTNETYAYDGSITELNDENRFVLKEALEALIKMLTPFTPHIAEELWSSVGYKETVVTSPWPQFIPELAGAEELIIAVQLNGKLITTVTVPADANDQSLKEKTFSNDKVMSKLEGRTIVKTIIVPKRLVNIVVKIVAK